MLEAGTVAPDFTLAANKGGSVTLSALKGQKVVLYFYPKDDTPGCTKEACAFRDALPDFSRLNTTVIGISKDDAASHDKFTAKYSLNFVLAADVDGKVCEAYGTWVEKNMYGKKSMGIQRSTFIIDEQGVISKVWKKVSVDGHVEKVLEALVAG